MKRIEVKVEGKVSGYAASGESDEEAGARLTLNAEMLANKDGNPRLHLTTKQVLIPVGGRGTFSNRLAKEIAALLCKNGVEDVDAMPLAVDTIALIQNHMDTEITSLTELYELKDSLVGCEAILDKLKIKLDKVCNDLI